MHCYRTSGKIRDHRLYLPVGRHVVAVVFILLLLMLTAACGQQQRLPTITPSRSPTASPSATHSPSSTATPTIAQIPTATWVVIPLASYDLPSWMGNPQTEILASLITQFPDQGTPSSIAFVNANTGGRFDMQVPLKIRSFFWFDSMHFGLLSEDLRTMYLIDISTGQVSPVPVADKATRLVLDNYSAVLRVDQDPLSPNQFVFRYASPFLEGGVSSDTRFFAVRDANQQESPVIVTDLSTGQSVWQSSPSDGYSDNHYAWSPVNDSYLAIVEGRRGGGGDPDFPVKDTTLRVIDVRTGEIVTSHKGDIGRISWSPDGTRILYTDALSPYWNFGYAFTKAPCILDVQSGEDQCIWNIPNHRGPPGYSLETTTHYQWSPDGKSIDFVYLYVAPLYEMIGNLCIYSLLNGDLTCPADSVARLPGWDANWPHGWSIGAFDFSPSGNYIHFCYSSNSLLSDDQGGPSRDGIIDIDGTRLISWVGLEMIDGDHFVPMCSVDSIWRPLP